MWGPLREGAPSQVGPYEVLAQLGSGGMGEVFLGRAREGDRRLVAVKTVRRDLAGNAEFRDRFRREIAVVGRVRSPYAARPAGGDADAAVPWLATEYVAGPTLSAAVRRDGPLPADAVRALGADLARTLHDLHAGGVLHRDLKPGNVLLDLDGPRLIDFGIARSQGATTMTATGLMVGTPGFMSPEHLAGARTVTTASDVFCLASLLCYAATGDDPFGDGPVAAVLYRVARAETDLRAVPDEELREFLAQCLSIDPAGRPTPEQLVEWLGGEREPEWPGGVRTHVEEYRRGAEQLLAAGVPLAAVAPAAPAASYQLHQMPTVGPPPAAAPVAPTAGRRWRTALAVCLAAAVVGGGTGLGLYLAGPDGKDRGAGESGGGGTGAARPASAGPPVPGVDDRGPADSSGAVPQNAAQRPAGWKPWQGKLSAPAFGCAAGKAVLVCRMTDGRYEALDAATGKRLWDTGSAGSTDGYGSSIGPSGAVFVANGSTQPTVHDDIVAFVSKQRLQVRDAKSGKVRWEKAAAGAAGAGTRPLVGDGMVFAATGKSGLTAFALGDGRALWTKALTNRDLARAEQRTFEPKAYANGLVYALSDAGLVSYDAKTGAQRGQVDKSMEGCDALLIHGKSAHCSERSVTGEGSMNLYRMDATTLAPSGSGRVPVPVEVAKPGPYPTAVDTRVVVVFDQGAGSYADWGTGGAATGLSALSPGSGAVLGRYAVPPSGGKNRPRQRFSSPLIAGDAVLYADFSALHVIPLGKAGKTGKELVVPVEGAPGPRVETEYDRVDGLDFAREIRDPLVLPIGGVAHVVYDTGVVSSVALPVPDPS
ncbi:serine/threonine-protein kinase [Streptomyces sp. NBC_01142]|uniref:protein kinase domain-containing protein n=1 Tax=Streptomyces sp. NBC_01142 TaxID=2975865 RepID=UPI002259DAA2|nr:protein kinase [Streptomyces sp. NBC_01142]MCX4821068.1 serine/threonine-protein kinase [Streptomyces sp. NBC_01142]